MEETIKYNRSLRSKEFSGEFFYRCSFLGFVSDNYHKITNIQLTHFDIKFSGNVTANFRNSDSPRTLF